MNKNETITKEYLEENFVTKVNLKSELATLEGNIISKVRTMNHELVKEVIKNSETYYLAENKRHMTALKEGFMDEMKVYKDGVKMIEDRVEKLEFKIA